MRKIIVVNDPREWVFDVKDIEVTSSREYLTDPRFALAGRTRVFNLANSYAYQSRGYYVSLLAEARGHKVIPDAKTIIDLRSPSLVKVLSRDLEGMVQQHLAHKKKDRFELSIYFGHNVNRRYDRLARELYKVFQAPLMRARFARSGEQWELRGVRPIPYNEIPDEHLPYLRRFAV
ncbi:MAG: RimK-like ATPgrasp N-terminal domain-containing protein, partial [Flavobacteriales bacterium]|nr:RimK-like ATPgrasp N-terminal domain-containing protein [Flavobacteriales bacterium]